MTANHQFTRTLFVLAAIGTAGCVASPEDELEFEQTSQAVTALTLSGQVRTAAGQPIPGALVTRAGSSQGTQLTDAAGRYSFPIAPGSYSLRVSKSGCSVAPDVVNLNNVVSNKVVDFTGTGSGCVAAVAAPRALILVDQRLNALLANDLEQYRAAASARRGFAIALRAIQGLDDMSPSAVREYVKAEKAQNPGLEGVLYVGNVKLPSFYKVRADIPGTKLYPSYFQDLDATFSRVQAPGSVDPTCAPENDPHCVVGDPTIVPEHDFDWITPGANPNPEVWAAFMPVGVAGSANGYSDFANQLRPYLTKVRSFYSGALDSNGRGYFVSNDIGEHFEWMWDAFGPTNIDFYGKPGPNGETGDACFTGGQNVCYQRWPTESFATAWDFIAHYHAQPWVAENWQQDNVFIPHMNANLYDVVEVNTHASEGWSIVSSDQARALTRAGLLVALDGCDVAGYYQPGSTSWVSSGTAVSQNLAVSYLYGSSKTLAALGDPFYRGHYGNHPLVFRELKVNHAYLGLAHLRRMNENYARSGYSPSELRAWAAEMLLGDPFMDLD